VKHLTITLPRRFNGPPDSANGGYSAGAIAAPLAEQGAVEVTLRRPPPLDRALELRVEADALECYDGDELVAHARVAPLELPLVPPVGYADAAETAAWSIFTDESMHPFPTCFACGPLRTDDGLRLFAGRIHGTDHFAASWTPDEIDDRITWAALDCPSSAPLYVYDDNPEPHVLGRITARVERMPRPGEPLVIMSWPIERDARKVHTASAVYDADEQCCAYARTTWISLAGG
jgi:hypothetical protein